MLPSLLASEAGQSRFEVDAQTVEQALRQLPVADMILDEHGELRRLVNIYVEGEDIRHGDGLLSPVADGQTVRVVAAIAGG